MLSVLSMYVSLFVASFLSASIFPLVSDPMVVYMEIHKFNSVGIILAATAGSFIGSVTTYFLGFWGRERIIEKYVKVDEKKMAEYKKKFEKYGAPALLFTWIPFTGDALVAISGLLEINFIKFSVYTFLGKLIRFSFVAYLASFYR